MGRDTSQTETILRDNVRLYVDFRDAPFSQIDDFINQLKGLVRTVAVFIYLMIDPRDRPEVLKAINKLRLDDYIYLDLEPDHTLNQLGIDMVVTTSHRIQLYENILPLVSGRVKNTPAVINADHVSIDQILKTAREVYLSPPVSS
jgi:hypothetical protein